MALITLPIRLWYSPGACSFAPHVLLIETGLEFELVLSQVGHFTDEFLKLNPKARVPVLAIGDEIITEAPGILTMIQSLIPEKKLLGQTALETARVYEWLNYLSGTLHGLGFGALWRPERFTSDASIYSRIRENASVTIRQCYAYIEEQFASDERQYAVGQSYTIVDPFLFVFYSWAKRIPVDAEADYPLYSAWAKRVSQRDSFIEARKVHDKI